MEIRRETISLAAAKKRDRLAQQQLIAHDIESLEILAQTNPDDQDTIIRLQARKEELEEIIKVEAQGAYVRARTKHKVDGERPTRLFCSLEKHNGVQKYIPCLTVSRVVNDTVEEVMITNQEEIRNETVTFYKELYRDHDDEITIDKVEDFLEDSTDTLPKLTEEQKAKMEGLITMDELTKYLKKCRNNVSPGSSGFTGNFFKFFWRNLKHFVLNSINYSFTVCT